MQKALALYNSGDLVPTISAPQSLEQWVQRNAIPTAEVDGNKTLLHQAQEEDKRCYVAEVRNALAEYQKQYSPLRRFAFFVGRGLKRYQPDLTPPTASPETQLLEQVVAFWKTHFAIPPIPVT